jgi:hypothetical protein
VDIGKVILEGIGKNKHKRFRGDFQNLVTNAEEMKEIRKSSVRRN